ncbi:poly-beta-1,6-N-acetyl-D-glucosamine biosynthesis protein PgaD [Lysobacter sp. HA35]
MSRALRPSTRPDSRLIVRRSAQPRPQRAAWAVATLLAWGFFLHLWKPLAVAAFERMAPTHAGADANLHVAWRDLMAIVALPVVAIVAASLLIAWAEYNRLRFKDAKRRVPACDIDTADIAAALGATPSVARALSESRIAIVHMDAAAHPVSITVVLARDANDAATEIPRDSIDVSIETRADEVPRVTS